MTRGSSRCLVGLVIVLLESIFAGYHSSNATQSLSWDRFYAGIDGGYSMSSSSTNFTPTHGGKTDFSTPENTDFQRDIGNTGMIGGLIGYQVNDDVGFYLNYDDRNSFSWEIPASYPSLNLLDLDYFANKITIQTLIANIEFHPHVSWSGLKPYVNAGVGAAFNSSGHIKTINPAEQITYLDIQSHTSTNFAWNVGLGGYYRITKQLIFTMGYRFVDAGVLTSGASFISTGSGATPAGSYPIIPFKANQILLHEVLFGLRWQLDSNKPGLTK